jgi:hypothetical protein
MSDKTFAETIDHRLAAIERVVESLAGASAESDLRDLRVLLIDVISLLKRDPGVEAAADDLDAAAAALVKDSAVGSQPLVRKLRLLRDARQRFHDRLIVATARTGDKEYRGLQEAAIAYAARLTPSTTSIDLAWYRKLSA